MEREKFYLRLDLQIEAEDGKEIVGIVNNFLNNPEIGAGGTKLVGMTVVKDYMRLPQVHQPEILRTVPLLETTLKNPLSFVDQERRDAVFRRLVESVKSGSGFVNGMDRTGKLVRSLPGLTRENLYYWEKKGYIHSDKVQRRARKSRVYPTQEAFKIAYVWHFLHEGFALPTAAKMAEQELLKIKESQPTFESEPEGSPLRVEDPKVKTE